MFLSSLGSATLGRAPRSSSPSSTLHRCASVRWWRCSLHRGRQGRRRSCDARCVLCVGFELFGVRAPPLGSLASALRCRCRSWLSSGRHVVGRCRVEHASGRRRPGKGPFSDPSHSTTGEAGLPRGQKPRGRTVMRAEGGRGLSGWDEGSRACSASGRRHGWLAVWPSASLLWCGQRICTDLWRRGASAPSHHFSGPGASCHRPAVHRSSVGGNIVELRGTRLSRGE